MSNNRPVWGEVVSALLVVAGLLPTPPAVAETAAAADWPEFRGSERAGIAHDSGLSRSWPEGGPPVVWRRPLGEGYSQIAVVGEHLYTLFAVAEDEFAAAFRVADGFEVWRRRIGDKFHDEYGNGPRATPTIDGELLYVLATKGMLLALDRRDGTVVWQHDLGQSYPPIQPMPRVVAALPPEENVDPSEFGHASSPLVEGDLLIVYTGSGGGQSLVAFAKKTGEVLWTAFDNPAGHSSPIAVTIGGRRQIVAVLHDELVAVGTGGEVLWRHPWAWSVTQPVFLPPDQVFVSGATDVGALLVAVTARGDQWTAKEVWRAPMMRHVWSSPVLYEGHLFGFDRATFRCRVAHTGELRWAQRGFGRGSVVIADALLIILSDDGRLFLAAATPEEYRETGRAKILAGPSWTLPTPAHGKLFLRNHQEMVCLDLKGVAR